MNAMQLFSKQYLVAMQVKYIKFGKVVQVLYTSDPVTQYASSYNFNYIDVY